MAGEQKGAITNIRPDNTTTSRLTAVSIVVVTQVSSSLCNKNKKKIVSLLAQHNVQFIYKKFTAVLYPQWRVDQSTVVATTCQGP